MSKSDQFVTELCQFYPHRVNIVSTCYYIRYNDFINIVTIFKGDTTIASYNIYDKLIFMLLYHPTIGL